MGLVRNALAGIGCLTVLAAGALGTYQYRRPLARAVKRIVTERWPAPDSLAVTGRSSDDALRRARRKEAALARTGGPDSVVVAADEIAALIDAGLDPVAQAALDSLSVRLEPGRLTLEAEVRTAGLGRELLGPLSGILAEREPLRMSGTAAVTEPGLVAWRPDELQIRAFPFPASLVPRVVDAITGRRDGAIRIPVPPVVDAVAIGRDGVVFYRRVE